MTVVTTVGLPSVVSNPVLVSSRMELLFVGARQALTLRCHQSVNLPDFVYEALESDGKRVEQSAWTCSVCCLIQCVGGRHALYTTP